MHRCVMVALLAVGAMGARAGYVKAMKADLDGDGKSESIGITGPADWNVHGRSTGAYALTVGKLTVTGRLNDGPVEGVEVVDIDPGDRYREVVVGTYGPSDDFDNEIWWYDGKRLAVVGHLRSPRFAGGGIVYDSVSTGWYTHTDKYVLEPATHRLREVPQDLYWVGVQANVGAAPFPLARSRGDATVVARARAGSTVMVVVTDGKGWYLVKTESGVTGWATWASLDKGVMLNKAD